ncbi:MAG TPA: hypothetical protein VFX42_01535, partial [Gemmatimonadales bacterium]|nr:hypothetical protein [Gemmatimonadales bacterium]
MTRNVSNLTPLLSFSRHIFRRPVGPGLRHSERAWPSESSSIPELRPSLSAAALLKESSAWPIVKGADLEVEAAARVEEVRKAAEGVKAAV